MHSRRIPRIATLLLAAVCTTAFPFTLCAQPAETTPAFEGPLKAGEPILTIESGLHAGSLRSMAVDRQNRYLVTGSSDKTIRIWDLPSGNPAGILRPPIGRGGDGLISAVAVSPDGNLIACGGRRRQATCTSSSWESTATATRR